MRFLGGTILPLQEGDFMIRSTDDPNPEYLRVVEIVSVEDGEIEIEAIDSKGERVSFYCLVSRVADLVMIRHEDASSVHNLELRCREVMLLCELERCQSNVLKLEIMRALGALRSVMTKLGMRRSEVG